MPSLARNASARLAADVSTFLVGGAIAVVTARWLGPGGRGVLTALAYLAGLFLAIASLGLNEAAVVMVGRRRTTMAAALSTNVAFVALTGTAAAAMCALVASLQVQPGSAGLWLAVAIAAASVLVGAVQNVVAGGLFMTERIVHASIVIASSSVTSLVATLILVVVLGLGVLGAVLATTCGAVAGLLLAASFLPSQLELRPRWDTSYLVSAIRYGAKVQAAHLITLLAGRLDLLIAFSLLGAAAAGQYSIALTIASIVGLAPFALSYATFPRLAYVPAPQATELTLLVWRRSVVAALIVAVGLAAASPIGIPLLFGEAFAPALTPTLILLAGSLFAGGQWSLARAAAARGQPGLLLRSFGLSTAVMVGLDFALMPPFGLVGAAVASTVSTMLGLAVCVIHYWRNEGISPARLRPRAADIAGLAADTLTLVRGLAEATGVVRRPR